MLPPHSDQLYQLVQTKTVQHLNYKNITSQSIQILFACKAWSLVSAVLKLDYFKTEYDCVGEPELDLNGLQLLLACVTVSNKTVYNSFCFLNMKKWSVVGGIQLYFHDYLNELRLLFMSLK